MKGFESLRVQVVLSRYQGDRKISSLPYTMTVTTNAPATSLRMGAEIPISTTAGAPVINYNYRDVGTSIDCLGRALEGGRYALRLTIEDSSVYPDDEKNEPARTTRPSFRNFKADENLILTDGQSAQYTTATDKVTGEVVKVDVTLTVLK